MPKTVKAFVWLSVLYVLFGAVLLAWNIHDIQQSTILANVPAPLRDSFLRDELGFALRSAGIHTAIFATLAGLAAFGRRNWARWALAVYFVLLWLDGPAHDLLLYLTLPKAFHLLYGGAAGWWQNYLQNELLPPLPLGWLRYVSTAVWLTLLTLIFSPNARPWFRRADAAS